MKIKHTAINCFVLLLIFAISSCNKGTEGNHLINESSPYLLQHAFNPVDWYPWGEDALEKADNEDKLIVISVGYAACHWCHVMEEESFEDSLVSEIMNESFVSIKVDREERPDIDGIYMKACNLLRNKGCGWPLNIIALPDGRPVFAGTYYEKDQWIRILEEYKQRMKEERDDLEDLANDLKREVVRRDQIPDFSKPSPVNDSLMTAFGERMKTSMDTIYGGRIGSQKFPNPSNIDLLLSYGHLFRDSQALDLVYLTLDNMAYGGIYDQLGGGFSRYSVDPVWRVPHFEKMLYDNAQLINLYSKAYRFTDNEEYKRVALETIEFCERELSMAKKPYYSSLDADSQGEEGRYYVWTEDEINSLLAEDKMLNLFKSYYSIGDKGVWEYGRNILFPQQSIDDFAASLGLDAQECRSIIQEARKIVFESRQLREAPGLDDKSLVSWNGLMIEGLCEAYISFGDPKHLDRAKEVAQFIMDFMIDENGRLNRNFKSETVSINAFLDDYANLASALIILYEVSFEEQWLEDASKVVDYAVEYFSDEESPLMNYTSKEDKELMSRNKDVLDGDLPSSNSTMARVISNLGVFMDNKEYKERSMNMLQTIINTPEFDRYVHFYSNWGALYLDKLQKMYEVVVVGPDAEEIRKELMSEYYPNVYFMGSTKASDLPLLKAKFVEGQNNIYICKYSMCKFPVHTTEEAIELLEKEFNKDKIL